MTHSTHTYQTTIEFDNYLKDNSYFDGEDEVAVNQKILALWDTKFNSAITADITSKFDGIDVNFIASKFELAPEDNQGACIFFQNVVLTDKVTSEFIKAFVKTLVNYNKTNIYLDSTYATVDNWQGTSKQLRNIFELLKNADKNFCYFHPISLNELVK